MKRILALILVLVLCLGLTGCKGEEPAETVVLKTDHFQVDAAMLSYFIYSEYTIFLNDNADYLSLYGLDASVPLAEQECILNEGGTWLEYFIDQANDQVEEYLLLAEHAKAAGLSLGQEEQEGIEIIFDAFYDNAKKEGYEPEEYLEMSFGKGIMEDDIRRCLELSSLAQKYYEQYNSKQSFTDEEIEQFYQENRDDYTYVDYYVYDVEADTNAQAKKRAEKIATATDYASFIELVKEDLGGLSEQEISAVVQKLYVKGNVYYENKEYSEWLFTKATVGETLVLAGSDEGCFSVYLCAKTPYRAENLTRNVRYIPLFSETYDGVENAKKQAINLLAQLYQGGLTDALFSEIAAKYSEHENASHGGLMENADRDGFMEEIGNWFFSDKRTIGQCEVVSLADDYGYAVCQYLGEGVAEWKADCLAAMKIKQYQKDLSTWKDSLNLEEQDWEQEVIPDLKR